VDAFDTAGCGRPPASTNRQARITLMGMGTNADRDVANDAVGVRHAASTASNGSSS